MRHLPRTFALAVLVAAPLTVPAQHLQAQRLQAQQAQAPQAPEQASPERGEEVARRWCAGCHLVAPDQLLATTEAPSFVAIAEKSAAESEGDFGWLALFLADPHPAMPRLSLSRQQIRDLGAYLASLPE